MAVEVLEGWRGQATGHRYKISVMFCNTSDWAFGPVFGEDDDPHDFMRWLETDPRVLSETDLGWAVEDWRLMRDKNENDPITDEDRAGITRDLARRKKYGSTDAEA